MANWIEYLKCKKCEANLNIPYYIQEIICKKCGETYKIVLDNTRYAVAESGTTQYYKFSDDGSIQMRYFINEPVDTLDEAYQDTVILNPNECNPHKLLDIVKKYHDALKMRMRRLIEVNPDNLGSREVDFIKYDNHPRRSLNIKNLFIYLKQAYPHKSSDIGNIYNSHKDMIERIWWIRNKSEHISHSQWPINAKIFQNLQKNPDSPETAQDNLNYDFVKRVNHTVIEIYKFILSLRTTPPDIWKLEIIESLKVN